MTEIDRRRAQQAPSGSPTAEPGSADEVLLFADRLVFPWPTRDPFLFCVHHDDRYPAGDEALGPAASLEGRRLGEDFAGIDGWNMYHGRVVPGFPQHPHRGFETITVVRSGLVDHSDSLGATGRYGNGDVQWMSAGRGILHAEMFPLLRDDAPNPLDLFQIWLNLPARSKMSEPHYEMLWSEDLDRRSFRDDEGRETKLSVVAGALGDLRSPAPPPRSWAADEAHGVAVWTIEMAPGARWTLPPGVDGAHRTLYFHRGAELVAAGRRLAGPSFAGLRPTAPVELQAGTDGASLLLLQGREIGEPVARQGPFVMNSDEELRQTFRDFRTSGFGGWPWESDDPVHPRERGRFARHADGRVDERGS